MGIPVTTTNTSSMDLQGVFLSITSSMDVQGVSLSTTSSMDVKVMGYLDPVAS
jgi:hypothetical protein